jgi:hypothetical protein
MILTTSEIDTPQDENFHWWQWQCWREHNQERILSHWLSDVLFLSSYRDPYQSTTGRLQCYCLFTGIGQNYTGALQRIVTFVESRSTKNNGEEELCRLFVSGSNLAIHCTPFAFCRVAIFSIFFRVIIWIKSDLIKKYDSQFIKR